MKKIIAFIILCVALVGTTIALAAPATCYAADSAPEVSEEGDGSDVVIFLA